MYSIEIVPKEKHADCQRKRIMDERTTPICAVGLVRECVWNHLLLLLYDRVTCESVHNCTNNNCTNKVAIIVKCPCQSDMHLSDDY